MYFDTHFCVLEKNTTLRQYQSYIIINYKQRLVTTFLQHILRNWTCHISCRSQHIIASRLDDYNTDYYVSSNDVTDTLSLESPYKLAGSDLDISIHIYSKWNIYNGLRMR